MMYFTKTEIISRDEGYDYRYTSPPQNFATLFTFYVSFGHIPVTPRATGALNMASLVSSLTEAVVLIQGFSL
jgi:hypothetical protein